MGLIPATDNPQAPGMASNGMILVPLLLRVFRHSELLLIHYGESSGAFEGDGVVLFEVYFEFSIRMISR